MVLYSMNNNNLPMTVADLIAALQTVDPRLPVIMTMNGEYESSVRPDMVFVDSFRRTRNGVQYSALMIDSEGQYDYTFSDEEN